tara:strand:+ start:1568 stop:2629 length:1062 start_codon:yes stop_codon:yes gene_type:complete
MAFSAITKPSLHFNSLLYSGDGGTQAITGVGFEPDFSWLKCRSTGYHNRAFDTVNGAGKNLITDNNAALETVDEGITTFGSDGFTVKQGSTLEYNASGQTYVSWNWKAGTTTGITTNGSTTITPDSYSFNQTAGFSIIKYTGNATSGAKVPHGLGVTPSMFFVKVLSTSNNWGVYFKGMGGTKAMYLDSTDGETSDVWLNNTAPDDVNFTLSNGNYGNTSGNAHVAYCFANIKGFSQAGWYYGNQSSNGTYCYLGFAPAYIFIKKMGNTSHWNIFDRARSTMNVRDDYLKADSTDAETTGSSNIRVDFLSNGFKLRGDSTEINQDTQSLMYFAVARNPLVSNSGTIGVPGTAV